jgi:acyl-CoA synthetase (AMP-forming)/AMP-acid ligase II
MRPRPLVCRSWYMREKSWSFKESYDTVLRYVLWLHNVRGVKPEEVVALDFVNCPEFIFLWLALWSLGAILACINYNLTSTPLIQSLHVMTARFLIMDPKIRSVLTSEVEAEITSPTFTSSNAVPAPLKIAHSDHAFQPLMPYHPPYRAPDPARAGFRPRDPAILIYTSGTTGLPKPAISPWAKSHIGGA